MQISQQGLVKIREGATKSGILSGIRRRKVRKIKEKQYYENPNFCINCNKILDYDKKRNKCCSKKCSNSYFIRRKKSRITINKCINCYKETINNKYCNIKCQQDYIRKQDVIKIENNETVSSRKLKQYLLRKYNKKCQKCGWSEANKFSNTLPLELHHKDNNHENNIKDNVELLCPNCHSLTDNHKGRNKRSTRTYRKKYYAGVAQLAEQGFCKPQVEGATPSASLI